MNEAAERARVAYVAKSWVGTPYHTGGRVKGVGVDCLTILAEVFEGAGLVDRVEIPYYPHDWHLHQGAERYLEGLTRYLREVEGPPGQGDVALWKFGRCFSHGAIVTDWPTVVHAYVGKAVCREDVSKARWLTHVGEATADRGKPRPVKFFSYWKK